MESRSAQVCTGFRFTGTNFITLNSAGYDWCVATIKKSEYARLASELEINKAVMFLKQKQLPEAVNTLKAFEKDSNIAINAAVNLSFIYFLVS